MTPKIDNQNIGPVEFPLLPTSPFVSEEEGPDPRVRQLRDALKRAKAEWKLSLRIITPGQSEEWLKNNNKHNRPLSRKDIERYAASMESGRWLLNGETIIFDNTGNLLNGQHRLVAVGDGISRDARREQFHHQGIETGDRFC